MIGGKHPRAQASLPVLAIALLVLSSVTVVSLAVADGALAAAERDAEERHVATSVADRLVAASGPVAVRENVLADEAIDDLNATTLDRRFSVIDGDAVRVSVGGNTVVAAPNTETGTTVERIVTVRRTERRSITPALGPNKAITLPRRTDELAIDLTPPNGTTIRSIRANQRILLRNTSGLDGRFTVDLSRFETARIQFVGPGPLEDGNVTLEYPIERTNRATLAVTVDG